MDEWSALWNCTPLITFYLKTHHCLNKGIKTFINRNCCLSDLGKRRTLLRWITAKFFVSEWIKPNWLGVMSRFYFIAKLTPSQMAPILRRRETISSLILSLAAFNTLIHSISIYWEATGAWGIRNYGVEETA